ncbi:12950_t:CDS:1 [Funneliformis geosporum]|nr:12950_t:CDS:1 [Funneliformis geosporum]
MGFWSFVGKVAVSTVAGIALGPAAIPVGASVWGGSEIVRRNCDDEDVKEVFGFISDCGRDTLTGGTIGLAAQGAGALVGMSEVSNLGSSAARAAAKKAAGEFFIVDGIKIFNDFQGVEIARNIALAKHGVKVAGQIEFWTSKGFEVYDATKHVLHKLDGISYKSGCKVCED